MSIVGTPFSLCVALSPHALSPRLGTLLAMTALSLCSAGGRLLVLATVSLLGTSCEEASEPQATVPAASQAADSHALVRREWLTQHDRIAPDRWLASRAAGVDVAPDDPSVATMHALLVTARERFGDSTRMIANRAVQLEATLKMKGINEKAPAIIESFSRAAGQARPFDGFGAMCQNYSTLREQGMGKEEALAHLAATIRSSGASASIPPANNQVR
jgi:hypothetical protein